METIFFSFVLGVIVGYTLAHIDFIDEDDW